MYYLAFRDLIENEIGNPNSNDASSTRIRTLILQWANAAYREIGRRHAWSWLEETNDSLTLSAGSNSYTLPGNIRRILDLFDTSEIPPRRIEIIPPEQYWDGGYEFETSGDPDYARVWKGVLLFDREAGEDIPMRYRAKLNVSTLNETDNGGLGTEILLPDSDIDLIQDGVYAYWLRYKKDPDRHNAMANFIAKIASLIGNDNNDPDTFYPTKTPRCRGTTFRLVIDNS